LTTTLVGALVAAVLAVDEPLEDRMVFRQRVRQA
jgi:hypothetical protein